MLILEEGNRIIEEKLKDFLKGETIKDALDLNFCDFGETRYHLWTDEADRESVILSMAIPGAKELFALGLKEYLGQKLSGAQILSAEEGFSVSLRLTRSALLSDEQLGAKVAMLRKLCLSLPLEVAMEAQKGGKETAIMAIPLRDTDVMYVKGMSDRVILVLGTKFDDPSDAILGKVFMQEFYDVRRLKNLQNAPSVLYGKEPPNELKGSIPVKEANGKENFITLILFPTHYSTDASKEKSISAVLAFRDYFHFHIKCCKSFLHDRMRAKVSEFLKVLNRTKPVCLAPKAGHQ